MKMVFHTEVNRKAEIAERNGKDKDDNARAFYERFGFVAAPTDPCHLFVLLKDVRAILKQR